MTRLRPASGAAAIAALFLVGGAHAQAPESGPASSAPTGTTMPTLVHVVPIPCSSGLLDVPAFASALRVELMQQDVRAVDIVRPDTSPSDVPATIVEVRALPCDSSARALTFTVRGLWLAGPAHTATIDLSDVDFANRPRVAALAVAEAFEVAQTEAAAAAPGAFRRPASSEMLVGAGTTAPSIEHNSTALSPPPLAPPVHASPPGAETTVAPSIESNATAVPPPRVAPATHASTVIPLSGSSPSPLAAASDGFVGSAMLDLRYFTAYATGLLGPRAALSSGAAGPLRLQLDAGAAFGSAHDTLGAIELTLLSGAASLTLLGRAGAISIEIGPRIEVGWSAARGSPMSPGVSGAQLDRTFAAASLLGALGIQWSARWRGMLSVDVGDAFAGLVARSDGRPTAGTVGPTFATRVGFSYSL